MTRILLPCVVASIILVGCGSSSPAEATYIVSENSCRTQQTFTRAEVIETWGADAIVNGELRGAPAAINKECAGK